jgi:hypothetical protein
MGNHKSGAIDRMAIKLVLLAIISASALAILSFNLVVAFGAMDWEKSTRSKELYKCQFFK